jgi:hypothetical protein
LALIINEEDAVLIPKNQGKIFALRIFWRGVSCYAATPLIVALSPGHSDITRFCPWLPFVTGYYLNRTEKVPNLLRKLAPPMFLIHVQAYRDPLRAVFRHAQIFMNGGPNALT